MVLFTPITTLILDGVKLMELLSPTPRGRITWTVPGWVEAEVVVEVEVVVLDVWAVEDDEGAVEEVEVDEDEAPVDILDVELVGALVVEEVDVDVLGPVEALNPVDEVVEAVVCELECPVVVDEGWKSTSVASTPARRTSAIPDMSTSVQSRPARPGDLLLDILSLVLGRWRALFCLPLDDGELREA
jgi:hypothetical protein